MFDHLTSISVLLYPTGELSIRLDGSALDDCADCITLPITARDDGGIYLSRDDSDRLAEFIASRQLVPTPR